MKTVNLQWAGSTLMLGADSRGNTLAMGTHLDHDPQWMGLKPSDLLLLSAASCSSWDVITILTKQKQPLQSLDVRCTGEQSDQPPSRFTAIHLHYNIGGPCDPDKVARAIELSQTKYCSVINSFNQTVKVTYDFEIQG